MTAQPLVPPGSPDRHTGYGALAPVGPHLGERVSALVDGALPADARDRALVHLGGCDQCRAEVDSARLLKARLAALPTPAVPADLTARLLAMGEPGGPVPPRPSALPSQPRMLNVPGRPGASRPQGSRPAGRVSRTSARPSTRNPRRTVRLAALAGAALSTIVVAVVGFSGGVGPESQPQPPVSQLTSNLTGFSDPLVDVSIAVRKARTGTATLP